MRSSPIFFVVLFAFSSAACTRTLPPPAPPARELPPLDEPLPEVGEGTGEGLSRVVITTDVPARVERIAHVETIAHRGSFRTSTVVGRELLCAETPCTVSLPYGDHELIFAGTIDRARTSSTQISVRRASTVVNHTLGQDRTHPARPVATVVAATGIVLMAVAIALVSTASERHEKVPEATAPIFMAGMGTTMLGGIFMAATPTTLQDGATTQWTPGKTIAGATVSAGVRF